VDEALSVHRPAMTPDLTPDEIRRYEWQLAVAGFGEAGQRRLKRTRVLISRIGGVGGSVAWQLAAAGVGKLVLAHAGNLRLDDLNRQTLMTTAGIGQPRVDSARRLLADLNPHVEIEIVNENISEANAARLVERCDIAVGAAPLFEERLLMNRHAASQNKPLVDCAMYELEGRLTTIIPGKTPCLACLYPESPPHWKRRFPVFGAVAAAVGSLAAMEVIKLAAGVGEPLAGRLLTFDLRDMSFRSVQISRLEGCPVCGHLSQSET
jgi:molybdopterin/thiamine biosynthesis adenylyltransferase